MGMVVINELLKQPNKNGTPTLAQIQKYSLSGNYGDHLVHNAVVQSYDDGNGGDGINEEARLVLSFAVTKELCNVFDTLHGGAQATAVDIFTSAVLRLKQPNTSSVTSDLHISCISSAPLGSTVICVCKILKAGSGLQFASCEMYREIITEHGENRKEKGTTRRNILVCKGLHTKYILKNGR